ncbi:glycoside hydrolase [Exidia glandulosa HHB12029]|uniref:glucan 1,3-beta-glucosidase n=1 Tax=Exidia glandulosa HHB12029 TaxID=1314781 RepID=A0A165LAP2_EXIGL|nr:glycoside hydrolase [Exidia glandulosa HHB12029]
MVQRPYTPPSVAARSFYTPGHTPSSSQSSFRDHQPLVPPRPINLNLYGDAHDEVSLAPHSVIERERVPTNKRRRRMFIGIGVAGVIILLIIIIAVAVSASKHGKNAESADESPVSNAANAPNAESSPATPVASRPTATPNVAGGGANSPSSAAPPTATPGPVVNAVLTGADGSIVTTENGTTFRYQNAFGGNWAFDPSNPFKGGKANSWTPSIDQPWKWGQDRIQGVNLGGWLVLEPFITPAIFEKYAAQHVVDEWSLHGVLRSQHAEAELEEHYKTFITEQDFANIAGAGLNWVRIPLPYWAIERWSDEPFIERVSWTYFLKAIEWARKYGIRIQLDLHTVPGSQNGWNHSGRMLRNGNWLKGPMGVANAQRTLTYIRTLTQFIAQPQYSNVVPMFGLVNEPSYLGNASFPANDVLKHFYYEAYKIIRTISGSGGPVINIFDQNAHLTPEWAMAQFLSGADRLALDIHPYFAFGGQDRVQPTDLVQGACKNYAPGIAKTWNSYGIVSAGEWSVAVNDCGKWVSQKDTAAYEDKNGAGSCREWTNYESWSPELVAGFRKFWSAQADAYGDWFYWTWKIGASSVSGKIESPFWSYSLGLERGWIPKDPRVAAGSCAAAGAPSLVSHVAPKPSAVGAVAHTAPTNTAGLVWPPPSLVDQPNAAALPTFTPTGTLPILPVPTFTDPANPQKTLDAGSGLAKPHDSADGAYVPVKGCHNYLPAWSAYGSPVPAQCA